MFCALWWGWLMVGQSTHTTQVVFDLQVQIWLEMINKSSINLISSSCTRKNLVLVFIALYPSSSYPYLQGIYYSNIFCTKTTPAGHSTLHLTLLVCFCPIHNSPSLSPPQFLSDSVDPTHELRIKLHATNRTVLYIRTWSSVHVVRYKLWM